MRLFAALVRALIIALLGVLLASLLFVAGVAPTAAAEYKSGDSPTVPAGTRIDDDLYMTGGRAKILGDVTYDAFVSAGELEVEGRIGGNLTALVGRGEIRGPIGRSIRLAGGDVDIYGEVGGDVIVAGGTVIIARGATIRGDIIAAGGMIDVLGDVQGNVRGYADEITIDGHVGGDVRVRSDDIQLASQARVDGDLRYRGRDDPEIETGAVVAGTTEREDSISFLPGDEYLPGLGFALFRLLAALVAGAVIVLLLPRTAARIADGVRAEPLASLLVGFALLLLVPVGIVVLLVTVVGIPIAIIALAIFLAGLYLSQVFVGLAVGRFLLPNSWESTGRGLNLLAMVIGVAILAALRLIPVPFLGTGIAALTAIFGLGAIVVGLRRRLPGQPAGTDPTPGGYSIR